MNYIYINEAKIVYANKKLVTVKQTNKDISLMEYFIQDTVGEGYKQNLLIKVFTEDLDLAPLEVGQFVNVKGATLKIKSFKREGSEEFESRTEILVNKTSDIKVVKVKEDIEVKEEDKKPLEEKKDAKGSK